MNNQQGISSILIIAVGVLVLLIIWELSVSAGKRADQNYAYTHASTANNTSGTQCIGSDTRTLQCLDADDASDFDQ